MLAWLVESKPVKQEVGQLHSETSPKEVIILLIDLNVVLIATLRLKLISV